MSIEVELSQSETESHPNLPSHSMQDDVAVAAVVYRIAGVANMSQHFSNTLVSNCTFQGLNT